VTTLQTRLPGLVLAAGIAALATAVGRLVPTMGAPVIAILLGFVVSVVWRRSPRRDGMGALAPGLRAASTVVLQVGVVLLGARLSLVEAAAVGWRSVPIMIATLVACLLAAAVIGRALGVGGELRALIGIGTAICGASAIAAITPVLRAQGPKVAYALSTVFVFNIAAILLFPFLGHVLGMTEPAFAILAGTAINDTSSVVAAGTIYGPQAATEAVVVKLLRTLMLIPLSLGLAVVVTRRRRRVAGPAGLPPARRLIPWFLVGFVLMTAVNSAGWLSGAAQDVAGWLSGFFVTVALAAIGLATDVNTLRGTGLRPLLLGAILWLTVTGVALLGLALGGWL